MLVVVVLLLGLIEQKVDLASMAAMVINAMISKIAAKVQKLVDQEVGQVCNEIFGVLMGKIKTEILTLMGDMKKLEGPLAKVSSFGGLTL